MDYDGFRPYVPVGTRRLQAARELAKLKKKGRQTSPVVIEGRTIAATFWGEAWCDNLERYSDFANRLPRGRSYVRNGSVVDLQVAPGSVTALVSGSTMYDVKVTVAPVPRTRWRAICADCSGAIDSLVELLQGRFSTGVMTRLCEEKTGLFPSPKDIIFTCSCRTGRQCVNVQARRRRAVRHRRAAGSSAGATLHPSQGRSAGLDCDGRVRSLNDAQGASRREGARERRSRGDVRHRDGADTHSRSAQRPASHSPIPWCSRRGSCPGPSAMRLA